MHAGPFLRAHAYGDCVTGGLIAAIGACGSYGTASVFQAVAAQRNAGQPLNRRTFGRIAGQLPYVVGLGLDLAGFVLNVIALQSLPLFLVQSLVAASVAVTAVVAVPVLGVGLHRRALVGVLGVLVGLVLLAAAAKPGPAHVLARSAQWVLLVGLPVTALVTAAIARRPGPRTGPLLAGCAGCGFAAVAVAARSLRPATPWWHLVLSPCVWAIVGFGLLAIIAFTAALTRGSVTVATAVMSAVE